MEAIKRGQQAMVFVHSRKDTVKSARSLVLQCSRDSISLSLNVPEVANVYHPALPVHERYNASQTNDVEPLLFLTGVLED